MSQRSLRAILDELHERLERSSDLDPASQDALREAARDIRAALDDEPDADPWNALRDRIARALERFEGEHPRLTDTVRRLVDQLSEMGI